MLFNGGTEVLILQSFVSQNVYRFGQKTEIEQIGF